MQELVNELDGLFGEAYGGKEPNGSHINVVITQRGSAAYAAAIRTLASPSPGHIPFLACLGEENLIRPTTIIVNKVTIEDEEYGRLFSGAAQLGICQGVLDAIEEGLIDKNSIGEIALLVACWVDTRAKDDTTIRINSRDAMFRAIKSALTPVSVEYVQKQIENREHPKNNFYQGE